VSAQVEQAVADAKLFHDRARELQVELAQISAAGAVVSPELRRRAQLAQERAAQATEEVLIALRRYG
jgi:hypothetical protein